MTDTEWIKPGALCWYAPHQASDRKYAGVVATGNIHFCGATPCVSLKDMELAYRDGKRSTVLSAALPRVTQRTRHGVPDLVRTSWKKAPEALSFVQKRDFVIQDLAQQLFDLREAFAKIAKDKLESPKPKSIDAVRRLIEVASQMNIDDHTEEQWGELAQAVAEADEFMAAPCVCSCCGVLIPFDLCVSCQYDLSERGYLNKKVGTP